MYDFDFTFNSNSLSDPVRSKMELWAKTSSHRRKSGIDGLPSIVGSTELENEIFQFNAPEEAE